MEVAAAAIERPAIEDLPVKAQRLYRQIARMTQNEGGYCYAKQSYLARKLGWGVRTVGFYFRILVRAGVVESERTGRQNHCRILPGSADQIGSAIGSAIGNSADQFADQIGKSADRAESPPYKIEVPNGEWEEKTTHTISSAPNAPAEHPAVEAKLQNLRAFEALPGEAREEVEAFVRRTHPLAAESSQEFLWASVALFVGWRPYFDWLERVFIPRFPGASAGCLYAYAWFASFAKIGTTYDELAEATQRHMDDPRRDDKRWEGRFPRDAKRHLVRHILALRKERAAMTRAAPREPPPKAAQDAPIAPPSDFGGCQGIADALKDRIGEGRFQLWFAGKVRFCPREGGGVVVLAASAVHRDWIQKAFTQDIRAVVNGKVEFCVQPPRPMEKTP